MSEEEHTLPGVQPARPRKARVDNIDTEEQPVTHRQLTAHAGLMEQHHARMDEQEREHRKRFWFWLGIFLGSFLAMLAMTLALTVWRTEDRITHRQHDRDMERIEKLVRETLGARSN